LINQDGGPDAPFKLHLLTSVQPHKTMADKLSGKGSKAAANEVELREDKAGGGLDEDDEAAAAAGALSDDENLDVRPFSGAAAKAAGHGRGKGKGEGQIRQTKRVKA